MRDTILFGDCRETLKEFDEKARMSVTAPPYYGLRDYGGEDSQIGQEQSPEEFIDELVKVFREVRNVLTDDGTCWVNLGDSYYNYRKDGCIPKQTFSQNRQDLPKTTPRRSNKLVGYKDKDLIGIPWMFAFAMRADGWYLRQDIIWHKPNPMPEAVNNRCVKSHEYIFLFTKKKQYYFNADAIKVKDVRRGSVWSLNTASLKEAHFAVFPEDIPALCIKAGSKEGDVVLDPFMGSGTTALIAQRLAREWVGIELNPKYIEIIKRRTAQSELF